MQSITLYFREGSSDKVYLAAIEPKDGGHVVNFAYGRRGSTLNAGTKTSSPVSLETARTIFQKLVKEKKAKGYTPGENGTPYQHTEKEALTTGIHCQLLNAIDAGEVERLIEDSNYWMQEKIDGRRLLVQKRKDACIGINRQGLAVALPQVLVDDLRKIQNDFILDGEGAGDLLYVFDLLQIGGQDLTKAPFLERDLRLINLMKAPPRQIRLLETACVPTEKRQLFNRIKALQREGVVFKRIDAPYTAGRPASGGAQLKYKFYESASLIVGKINAKRSVSLLLQMEGALAAAGNVTIPPNHGVPSPGWIIECRYLYAFPESGHLYQPTFLGVREDLSAADCTTEQLKFRPSGGE